MTESKLDNLLQDLRSQGSTDSEGEFTLSIERAVAKWVEHGMELPYEWILNLVRFVVANGAADINVQLTNKTFTFNAKLSQNMSWPDLRELLATAPASLSGSARYLAHALWQLGYTHDRTLDIHLGERAFSIQGRKLHDVASEKTASLSLVVHHDPSWRARKVVRAFNAAVVSELSERAFVCPIPLLVDGLRLDQLAPKRIYGEKISVQQGVFPTNGTPLEITNRYLHHMLSTKGEQLTETVELPTPSEGGLWLFTSPLVVPNSQNNASDWELDVLESDLHWVENGTVREKLSLSLRPIKGAALQVFLPVDGLSQGLDGRLVRNENYRRCRRNYLQQLNQSVQQADFQLNFQGAPVKPPTPRSLLKSILFFRLEVPDEIPKPALTEKTITRLSSTFKNSLEKFLRELEQAYGTSQDEITADSPDASPTNRAAGVKTHDTRP